MTNNEHRSGTTRTATNILNLFILRDACRSATRKAVAKNKWRERVKQRKTNKHFEIKDSFDWTVFSYWAIKRFSLADSRRTGREYFGKSFWTSPRELKVKGNSHTYAIRFVCELIVLIVEIFFLLLCEHCGAIVDSNRHSLGSWREKACNWWWLVLSQKDDISFKFLPATMYYHHS